MCTQNVLSKWFIRCLWPCVAFTALATAQQRPTVTLTDGIYIGTTTSMPSASAIVNQFFGLPFAAQPDRFAAPVARSAGTERHEAVTQPMTCIQQPDPSIPAFAMSNGARESEDCLFLNIFAPTSPSNFTNSSSSPATRKDAAAKPVLVWFHGGGLFGGSISASATRPNPDASLFAAAQEVVVVAVQYRLGVFGFPGNVTGLDADGLNPGFRDQKAALKWVQASISAFGGDPGKVTIMGESGGGVSVDSQLISEGVREGEKGLFRGAIVQSGSLHTFLSGIVTGVGASLTGLGAGIKVDEAPLITLGKAMGCDSGDALVPCLKMKSVADINNAVAKQGLLFVPVDDGGKTAANPDNMRRARRASKVPILTGATFQEALLFGSKLQSKTAEEWAKIIYPNDTNAQKAVADAYAVGPQKVFRSDADAMLQLHSDYQFACITAYDGIMMNVNGNPTWRYVFNASSSYTGHGSELSYIWNGASQSSAVATELGSKIQDAWGRFIKEPSSGPGWARLASMPLDLADLGGEGDRMSITMIAPSVMDSRCPLFYDAYDAGRTKLALQN